MTKNADGVWTCSCGCGRVPVKPRRSWFSEECVQKWRDVNDIAHIRRKVFERDKGICSICKCDCEEEYSKWKEHQHEWYRLADWLERNYRFNMIWNDNRRRWEFPPQQEMDWTQHKKDRAKLLESVKPIDLRNWTAGRSTAWDADHIIPVVEGGGMCGLENYRTLCHPCHKQITKELAARRAQQRRASKDLQKTLALS